MSGSKGGSKQESDSSDDIAARISASIGAGQRQTPRPANSARANSLKTPRPVVVKSLRTLSNPNPAHAFDEDDVDTDALIQTEQPEGGLKPDLLWVFAAFVVLILVAGSFVAFMMITSVGSVPIKTTNRFASASPSPSSDNILAGNQTMQIGDGRNIPSPTPIPSASVEAVATALPAPVAVAPSAEATLAPPPLPPAASLAPPPLKAMVTPPPLKPPTLPSKAPVKPPVDNTPAYQVVVGPFDNKDDADSNSSELSDLGKAIKVQQDQGKFFLVVGDGYPTQDQALSLGEQLIQRGKQVTIKKK